MQSLTEHTAAVQAQQRWARRASRLVLATLGYNVVEAVVALGAGLRADSIALFGFGLDSVIECSAAGVLLWRLAVEARGADPEVVEQSERRVRRFIGGTFVALALYVVAEAGLTLVRAERPERSVVGVALAVASLVIMPLIAWAKLRAARELGSSALRAEAKETLACAYLSLALLVGLAANAALGWWWADPAAALAMVPWLVKEGLEGLRGESCDDDEHEAGHCGGEGCRCKAEGRAAGDCAASGEGCGCGGHGHGHDPGPSPSPNDADAPEPGAGPPEGTERTAAAAKP